MDEALESAKRRRLALTLVSAGAPPRVRSGLNKPPLPTMPCFHLSVLVTSKLHPAVATHLRQLCLKAAQRGLFIDVGSWSQDAHMPRERLMAMVSANNYAGICCTPHDLINEEVSCARARDPAGKVCAECDRRCCERATDRSKSFRP